MSYGGGPADWAAMQRQQRQQQMNNLVQMFMAMKQYQNEQGWRQKEWENKVGQQQFERPLEERRVKAYETMAGQSGQSDFDTKLAMGRQLGLTGQALMDFARGEKDEAQIRKEAKARAEGTAEGTPDKVEKPTEYDKRVKEALRLFKEGKMSEGELNRVRVGATETRTEFDKKKEVLDKKLEAKEITPEQYNRALYNVQPPDFLSSILSKFGISGQGTQANAPAPPPGAPPGTTFVRTEPDGTTIWKWPDGTEKRWRPE